MKIKHSCGRPAIPATTDIWGIIKEILKNMQMAGEILGKYYIERKAGVNHAVFRARNGLKNIVIKNDYLRVQATKMAMQVGSSKEVLKELGKGALKGLKITFFVSVAINSVDFLFNDGYRWTDWLGTTSTDIIKGVLSIGVANWVVLGAFGAGATIGIAPIAVGLFVGWTVSYLLNDLDTDHRITKSLIEELNHFEDWFFNKQTAQQREELRRKGLMPIPIPVDPLRTLEMGWR